MKSNKTVNLKQREIIIDTNGSNLKKNLQETISEYIYLQATLCEDAKKIATSYGSYPASS